MKILLSSLFLSFFAVTYSYANVPINSVISDFDNDLNVYDGDYSTSTGELSGESTIIVQFGKVQYLDEIMITLDEKTEFNLVSISASENFIVWSNIYSNDNFETSEMDIEIDEISTSYLKIIFNTDESFAISEIECFSPDLPDNEIMNIEVETGENTALITWDTEIRTMDYFYYMKKYNGEQESIISLEYTTNHKVAISGLLPGCEYLYKIVSESPNEMRLETDELSFWTEGTPFPEFWQLEGVSISSFAAEIFYKSNVPTKYEVYLGESEDDMESVITEKTFDDEQTFTIKGLQPEQTYYYKLYITDKNKQVLQTPSISFYTPPHNVALGKSAWGTFNYVLEDVVSFGYDESSVENITDGDLNYFGGMAVSYKPDNSDQYVVIDLGEEISFKKVNVYWWGLGLSRSYRIDLSNDGLTWETVIEDLDGEEGTIMRSDMGDLLVLQSIDLKKTARFVRLYVEAGTETGSVIETFEPFERLYLCEVSVIEDL